MSEVSDTSFSTSTPTNGQSPLTTSESGHHYEQMHFETGENRSSSSISTVTEKPLSSPATSQGWVMRYQLEIETTTPLDQHPKFKAEVERILTTALAGINVKVTELRHKQV